MLSQALGSDWEEAVVAAASAGQFLGPAGAVLWLQVFLLSAPNSHSQCRKESQNARLRQRDPVLLSADARSELCKRSQQLGKQA